MSKLEKQDELTIKKWCKSKGVLFIKFTPFGDRGWPDRIAIFPGGFHVWTELKRKGERPRELQRHRMSQLDMQGCVVEWFDSAEDCIAVFEEILEAALAAQAPPKPVEPPSGLRLIDTKGDPL